MLTIGSLFSGAGMLDEGVRAVVGGTVVWHAEHEPPSEKNPRPTQAAARVLAHRYPGVPNLGDVSLVDWSTVPRVDVMTGGFPCQDISPAGKRAGLQSGANRSGQWTYFAAAIAALRPQVVVIENVRGILSAKADSELEQREGLLGGRTGGPALRALGRVLGDLADLGYDARWCGLRAADVGAPHGRFRVFVVAWPAADAGSEAGDLGAGLRPSGSGGVGRGRPGHVDGATATHADGSRREGPEPAAGRHLPARRAAGDALRQQPVAEPGRCGASVAGLAGPDPATDAHGHGRRGRAETVASGRSDGGEPRSDGEGRGALAAADADSDGCARLGREFAEQRDVDRRGGADIAWGVYEPAIRRWERLTRPVPSPTEPGACTKATVRTYAHEQQVDGYTAHAMLRSGRWGARLAARLTEWMQGWPAGWVTDVPGITRNEALKLCGNGVVPQQAAEACIRLGVPELVRELVAA